MLPEVSVDAGTAPSLGPQGCGSCQGCWLGLWTVLVPGAVVAGGPAMTSVGHCVSKLQPGSALAPTALGSPWSQHTLTVTCGDNAPTSPYRICADKACLRPGQCG